MEPLRYEDYESETILEHYAMEPLRYEAYFLKINQTNNKSLCIMFFCYSSLVPTSQRSDEIDGTIHRDVPRDSEYYIVY